MRVFVRLTGAFADALSCIYLANLSSAAAGSSRGLPNYSTTRPRFTESRNVERGIPVSRAAAWRWFVWQQRPGHAQIISVVLPPVCRSVEHILFCSSDRSIVNGRTANETSATCETLKQPHTGRMRKNLDCDFEVAE